MFDSPKITYEEAPSQKSVSKEILGTVRPLAGSGFTIVINTNKRPINDEDEFWRRADLRNAMEKMIHSPEQYRTLFKFRSPYDLDTFNSETISKINFGKPTVEVGKKMKHIHGNLVIQVSHYSRIHIDRDELKRHILTNLHNKDIRNLHINIRAFNANRDTLLRYNNKELQSARGSRMFSQVDQLLSTGRQPSDIFHRT